MSMSSCRRAQGTGITNVPAPVRHQAYTEFLMRAAFAADEWTDRAIKGRREPPMGTAIILGSLIGAVVSAVAALITVARDRDPARRPALVPIDERPRDQRRRPDSR
jgi:hypothetical protein